METFTQDCLKKPGPGIFKRVLFATVMCLFLSLTGLSQNITKVEYFIDTDPGQGLAVNVPVTPAPDISDLNFTINIGSLSVGFHNLFIRSKDANSIWSMNYIRSFYKEFMNDPLPNITKMEFFFDTDPGFGHATNIPVTPGTNLINLSFIIDISQAGAGFHNLFIRGKDGYGKWGMIAIRPFYKEPSGAVLPNITRVEYFIGTDPGMGKGTSVSFTPGTNLTNLAFPVESSGLPDGTYNLFVRSKDAIGKWGLTNADTININNHVTLPDTAKLLNVTVPNGIPECYDATHTIILGGNGTTFVIQYGGDATLIAGYNILFRPGARIYPGGYLHGYITTNSQYCNMVQNSMVTALNDQTDKVTGIQTDDLFSVYPNPTPGKFRLELNAKVITSKTFLRIYDMMGATILKEELTGIPEKEYSMENRPAGVYMISIMSGDKIQIAKIIRVQ
ncbi:MAG: T9SS type A sorting domain-containing protein [Bacteroidales bacterium]|jgi:hypothetical protein|nr:T9SS type A sorting domain-containing protein [Bacteroidales bacterium]